MYWFHCYGFAVIVVHHESKYNQNINNKSWNDINSLTSSYIFIKMWENLHIWRVTEAFNTSKECLSCRCYDIVLSVF